MRIWYACLMIIMMAFGFTSAIAAGTHRHVYYDRSGNVVGVTSAWSFFSHTTFYIQGSSRAAAPYGDRRFWPIEPTALKLVKAGKIRQIHESFEGRLEIIAAEQPRFLNLADLLAYSPEGSRWDYKQELGGQDLYVLNGTAYLRDYVGNVIWATIMKKAGWPEWVALTGAGIYQTATGRSRLKFWLKNPFFFGDDPRDSQAIHYGYHASRKKRLSYPKLF